MLIAILATMMFFAMLAATFNAMRREISEARVVARQPRQIERPQSRGFGTRPW